MQCTGVSILQENLNYSPALSVVCQILPQILPQTGIMQYFWVVNTETKTKTKKKTVGANFWLESAICNYFFFFFKDKSNFQSVTETKTKTKKKTVLWT